MLGSNLIKLFQILNIFSSLVVSMESECFFFCRGLFCYLVFQPNNFVSLYAHKSVKLSDFSVTISNFCEAPDTLTDSPSPNLNLVAPSKLTQAADRPSEGFFRVIYELAGRISGLKDKLCGANGVTQITSRFAYTILPPADKLYAVDPVGVDIIIPSPKILVNLFPST